MAAPIDGAPQEAMALLVKLGLGFEYVPQRHNRDNPGRDPYWGIYVERHTDINPKSLKALAEHGFASSNGLFALERRWPK